MISEKIFNFGIPCRQKDLNLKFKICKMSQLWKFNANGTKSECQIKSCQNVANNKSLDAFARKLPIRARFQANSTRTIRADSRYLLLQVWINSVLTIFSDIYFA